MRFGKATALTLTALSISLAACGGETQAQKEVKQAAEAVEESYKAEADLTEAVAAGGPNEAVAEASADLMRAEGEAVKDHLEDQAKLLD